MHKGRLEAFTDGVMAIIITIMVLELKVPHTDSLAALGALWPVLLSYMLSFLYVGMYWNNHHHLMQACDSVNSLILWANLHLLFWLSLLPFTTGWMGENHFSRAPVLVFGLNLVACATAYLLLLHAAIRHQGKDSALARQIGRDVKGKLSMALYTAGLVLTWFDFGHFGFAMFWGVALLWVIPDLRLQRAVVEGQASG